MAAYIASGTKQRNQCTLINILMDSNTPDFLIRACSCALDVTSGLHISSTSNRVLLVLYYINIHTQGTKSICKAGNRTVSGTFELYFLTIDTYNSFELSSKVSGILRLTWGWRSW